MRHRLLGEPAFGPFRAYFRPPLEVVVLIKKTGRQYAEKGEIEASLLAEITSPMIPEDQYAAIVNGGA